MPRFYLPADELRGSNPALPEREAHHALHVLRLRAGDQVTLLDGAGNQALAEIEHTGRTSLALRIVSRQSFPPPACQITLLQALPKGKLIETIIEKATELGVARVVPLLTERVVSRLTPEEGSQKAARWQQTAIEAIKQCGAAWLPRVEAPATIPEILSRRERFDLPLLASLQPGSQHPRKLFQDFRHQHQRPPTSVAIVIGPEGDFSEAETRQWLAAGFLPIGLGPLTLRVETAALFCLSMIRYETL